MKPPRCGGFIFFHMADFRKLLVWQKAHAMSLEVDEVASTIRGVQYSQLRTQLTRSSASVPTNIVEGRAQPTEREFARFLRYAIASSAETEYHLITARDKGVISDRSFESLTDQVIEVRKMLYGLVDKLTKGLANEERPPEKPAAAEDDDEHPKELTA
jgi:four helix bundle protein